MTPRHVRPWPGGVSDSSCVVRGQCGLAEQIIGVNQGAARTSFELDDASAEGRHFGTLLAHEVLNLGDQLFRPVFEGVCGRTVCVDDSLDVGHHKPLDGE